MSVVNKAICISGGRDGTRLCVASNGLQHARDIVGGIHSTQVCVANNTKKQAGCFVFIGQYTAAAEINLPEEQRSGCENVVHSFLQGRSYGCCTALHGLRGRYWTYDTCRAFCSLIPCHDAIRRFRLPTLYGVDQSKHTQSDHNVSAKRRAPPQTTTMTFRMRRM